MPLKVSWQCIQAAHFSDHKFLDLEPFTSYSVSLAAVSSYGLGPFSEELQVTTMEDGKVAILAIDIVALYFFLSCSCSTQSTC